MNYRSYEDLVRDIRVNLGRIAADEYDLVVGIPRSGMIPAYILALYLNVSCVDLPSFINNSRIVAGNTRSIRHEVSFPWDAKRVLLVDDSIMTGSSFRAAVASLPPEYRGRISTLVVYSTTHQPEGVDVCLAHVPAPRVFEWNIFHHYVMSKACVDMDGVVCAAPAEGEPVDRYTRSIAEERPYIVPTPTIHTLITRRPPESRREVELWLRTHGVKYRNLVMLGPEATREMPATDALIRRLSEYYYARSELMLYVAGDPVQAERIVSQTGKPVYCVGDNWMRRSGLLETLRAARTMGGTGIAIARLLPQPIRHWLRPLYDRLRISGAGKDGSVGSSESSG